MRQVGRARECHSDSPRRTWRAVRCVDLRAVNANSFHQASLALAPVLLPRIAVVALAVGSIGCASDREHWSGGRKYDLLETEAIHVRRSRQQLDRTSGELELAWVAVRARDGAPDLEAVVLTVFIDANGDRQVQPAEIVERRETRERARKVQFSALRYPYSPDAPQRTARLHVTSALREAWADFALEPD